MNEIETYNPTNDLNFIKVLGEAIAKSGMFGCEKIEQGEILAWQCKSENKPPLEMQKNYHIINGKITKRADAMLADFRRAGGKFIFDDLKNPEVQSAKITFEDYKDFKVEYTLEDAKRAGLLRKGSPWEKTPAAMLRARLVSETLRAIAPEIVQGTYTPEEVVQFSEPSMPTENAAPKKPKKKGGRKIEAEEKPEPKPAEKIEIVDDVFDELSKLIERDNLEDATNRYWEAKGKIDPDCGTWRDLPRPAQERMLNQWDSFKRAISK